MPQIFETPVQIRFAHCDPAGIVFHPQYFTIFNGVVEDFLAQAVGIPFMELMRHGIGLPVAGIRCDFVSPSRPGDQCIAKLWIEHLGASSVRMAMTLECSGQLRVRMSETMVFVSTENMKPCAIPKQLREKMLEYTQPEDAPKLPLRA